MSSATELSQPLVAVPDSGARQVSQPSRDTRQRRSSSSSEQPRLTVVDRPRSHRMPMLFGLVAVVVLVVMFGFAAFHSQMASTQYELERIERELTLEQERLVDLQIQLDELNSPAQIERLARGALGMVDPSTPVDVVVDESVVAEVAERAANSAVSGSFPAAGQR